MTKYQSLPSVAVNFNTNENNHQQNTNDWKFGHLVWYTSKTEMTPERFILSYCI